MHLTTIPIQYIGKDERRISILCRYLEHVLLCSTIHIESQRSPGIQNMKSRALKNLGNNFFGYMWFSDEIYCNLTPVAPSRSPKPPQKPKNMHGGRCVTLNYCHLGANPVGLP